MKPLSILLTTLLAMNLAGTNAAKGAAAEWKLILPKGNSHEVHVAGDER